LSQNINEGLSNAKGTKSGRLKYSNWNFKGQK